MENCFVIKYKGNVENNTLPNVNDYLNSVDMGLPSGIRWAKSNIDITQDNKFALSPYQYEATFFSWGNIDGHNPNGPTSFAETWGTSIDTEPYVSSLGAQLSTDIPISQDAAKVVLGSSWRMPTRTEFDELFNNVNYLDANGNVLNSPTVITYNGVLGIRLQSKNNNNELFFALCGNGSAANWANKGGTGSYWSSTIHIEGNARYLYITGNNVLPHNAMSRHYGYVIRPVIKL